MERVMILKVNYLAERAGYQVSVVTTDQQGRTPFFELSPLIRQMDLGVNYRSTNGRNIVVKTLGYAVKLLQHKRRLGRLLKRERFDIVVSMFGHEIQFLTRLRDGSRKVGEIHFSKHHREQESRRSLWGIVDRIFTSSYDRAVRRLDAFVALTHEDRHAWPPLPNIHVIYNPSPYAPTGLATLDTTRVLAAGRLTYQKGFDILLDTWTIVHDLQPEWRLDIFGDGPDKEILEAQIDRLGLHNVITIHPPSVNIDREYLQSSVYVLSSRYEGLPMTLIEAMAHGVPGAAFTCKCGPRDVITDTVDGLLVSPEGSPEKLAEAILTLIENPTRRKEMGRRAAEKVQQHFSQEHIMAQWIELFTHLIKK